ncbi:glycine cleavage system protein GcvH [Streptomyces sp. CAI-21]|uniref:Glycine cleavage system H protein n=1 Tax=Streptomyces albidoflavus TaxID=1886 RepID=A0AA37BYY5_9ACTN|nr:MULTISPECIES: glycine cleavage system protein GcvH [Streptomyces]NUW08399.1 glycine cleavage system protein GcvH [Streptomyces sp. CAI-21]NVI30517.1 glycine cleavage system protein GcvH [Streptomyces sp. CAI-17]NEC97288.1 glycine cleavage system protein GcvH [Streptomyces albidoflavus]RZE54430.1 glycine cleavage system protein H [Streptomyces albidoflavus]UKL06784.1 glycine cleavage system protein GcvH [Streptomyces sp. NBU3104]
MNIPEELKYTEEHNWVRVLPGGAAQVGITSHAQTQLGDIVFVELPKVGQALDAGQAMGVIESVKAATDLYSPLAGKVTAVNDELEASPELINEEPYGDGWMVEIQPSDAGALNDLLDAAKYQGIVSGG